MENCVHQYSARYATISNRAKLFERRSRRDGGRPSCCATNVSNLISKAMRAFSTAYSNIKKAGQNYAQGIEGPRQVLCPRRGDDLIRLDCTEKFRKEG